MQTVPTGFSGVPPVGPATPLTDTAIRALLAARTGARPYWDEADKEARP